VGWIDGYGPQLATVFAVAWPGLREHLEQLRHDRIKDAGAESAEAVDPREEAEQSAV
jgi:hypothetical protein